MHTDIGRTDCPDGHRDTHMGGRVPPGIPSAVTKEPALLMLTWCFSTSSEIFRGSSYLGVRTNTTIKIAKKTPNNEVEGVKSAECELEFCSCGKLKGEEKGQERETNRQ